MVDHIFTTGSRVEVRSDDEGFKGACYVATIIENPKCNKYVVVYDHLMESEEEDSDRLTETVDVSYLRPLPPLDNGEIIKVYDMVDAYHRDGWWTGEIIEIVEDGKFLVYFDNPPDELIVERDDLRFHLEWVNGKWEKPQKKIYEMISEGSAVEVTFESENYNVWHLGNVLQVEGNNKFLVKYRSFGVDDKPEFRTVVVDSRCIRPSPPRLEEQEFDVLHKVDAYYRFCWWNGVIRRISKDSEYVVLITLSKVDMVCNHSNLRPRLDWIDGKWTTTSGNTKLLAIDNQPFKRNKQSNATKLHAVKSCGTTGKKNDAAVRVDEANMSADEKLAASSESRTPVRKNGKKQMRELENIEGSSGNKRSRNRKRGRPQRSLEEQIGKDNLMLTTIDNEPHDDHFMLSCKDYMKLILAERKVLTRLCRRNEFLKSMKNISLTEDQMNDTGLSTRVEKLPNESLSNGHEKTITNTRLANSAKQKTRLAKDQASKTVKKLRKEWLSDGHGETSRMLDIVPQNQGLTTNIHVDEDQTNETVVRKTDDHQTDDDILRDLNDDQPLLTDKSATATDGEAYGEKGSAVATKDIVQYSPLQNNIADIANGELGTPSAIISCDNTENYGEVPFVKCSPLWKSIDSMEIYSKIEQKPHFSLLSKCREETREGLAIGHMVIFSTVVEKISKLRFSDQSSVIKSYLETLADLEKHGFNVEPVRVRLMVLLATKEKERKLEEAYKKIKNDITNNVVEKDELGQEVVQIKQTMKELAKKLREVESRKVMTEEKISALQSKQEGICENVRGVKDEFESIVGSPL